MITNKHHYEFLVHISTFESQIHTLTQYSFENCECFHLLQDKLDQLCDWILQDTQQKISDTMGMNLELDRQLKRLRETAIKALCVLEKHQSECASRHQLNISEYLSKLSNSIQHELESAGIKNESRVLFVGSGSYPLSALTISRLTGAVVHGIDIDEQAVKLARQLDTTNLPTTFGCKDLITEFKTFNPSHIVVASLVEHKWELLNQLKSSLNDSHKVLIRFGNGLKSAFNYPFNPELVDGWDIQLIKNDDAIYDTALMRRS